MGRSAVGEGIASALHLARGEQMLLGDVLTAPRVPSWVVLSACDAARGGVQPLTARTPVGWGLAQAFVAAGSHAVVAPTRPVLDQTATAMMNAFYGALGSSSAPSVTEALRLAQIEVSREQPDADWSSFRVLVP